jgi:hypothetical protein
MFPRISDASLPVRLRGRWLLLARIAWVVAAILSVGVFISELPSEFSRLQTPCTDATSCVWVPHLTAENVRELKDLGLSVDLFAAYFVAIEVAIVAVSFAIGAVTSGAGPIIGWRCWSHSCSSRSGSLDN